MSIKSSVTQENILESRRTRVLTEKAKEQYEQTLTKFKDKLSFAWGKCQSELDNVMCASDDNVENLKKVRLSLSIVYGGYCMISDEFTSYMDTINSAESQGEVAHHATNFKRSDFIVKNVLKQIDVKISSAEYETRSNRSSRYSDHSGRTSRHSDRISQHSNSSSDAARRRAKADAAKVRVAYVQKEAELCKHQAFIEQEEKLHLAKLERQKQELNADMYVLQERKNCAAAEAEADALETISAAGESIHIPAHLNVPVVDTVLRTCNVCQSTEHPGALHFDGGEKSRDKEPVKTVTIPHNEKVTANCTRINNASGRSKSCAKILMVNVHPTQEPQNTVKMYALLDEQSNRSLVRPAFFQLFDKKYETVNYSLSTCSGLASATGRKACDFTVSALDGSFNANEREEIPTPDVALSYPHLSDLAQYIPDLDPSVEIVMLLGRDIPEVHHVQDQRIGPSGSPYAQQLHLGWTIIGETCLGTMHRPDTVNVNKTYLIKDRPSLCKPCPYNLRVKERAPSDTTAHDECEHSIFQRTRDDEKLGFSREDQEFLKIMDRDFRKDLHGRWTAPLPFKPHRPRLPNNKSQAVKRAHILDNTPRKDPIKRAHFITFMQKLFEQKHAELAPPLHDGQECWYLPIFGVYHPKKRDQIRGVFDSSAKHDGLSLNNVLMSGPDMTNNLPGILLRFRREQVAVTADVQQMFYNFFVCEDHRNFLRFLWYQDNDMSKDLVEYRMCVHVFGNTPSPAVATYGLRRTACENADNFGYDMKEFVEQDFYVDDGLMSLPSAPEAIDLMKHTQQALATAGIRLHKVASNSTQVLKSFPQEDLAKDLKDLEIGTDSLPVQHSLGLSWDLESDSFLFRISPDDKPYTRRGVLSVTNSLFDPLGFIAPVAIGGKILLRSMTTGMFDWDETLPSKFYNEWERWRDSLHDLQDLRIPRQYTSSSFKECENISVHVFSDASEKAIASVGYLLTACEDGTQELGFILGKTKVAPLHTTTIPRLELCAAVLAIEIAETISEQLNLPLSIFRFYTDSKVVLGYVYNQTRRFYNYVCNRVTRIRKSSTPEQWNFVSTEHNPADQGTRPIHAKDLLESKWLHAPTFLLEGTEFSRRPCSRGIG
ncbi:uncharacterized protein [Argopecten irradians]|uniref:uncharacterized protein n=1 Tax=Argopecten irradians TaxID=31199 RepID=UPI00372163F6